MRVPATTLFSLMIAACGFDAGGEGVSGAFTTGASTSTDTGMATSSSSGSSDGSVVTSTGSSGEPPSDTTSGSTSGATTGLDSSSSGGEPTLIDEGLIGRWFIDEADMGKDPPFVVDSVDPPMNLVIEREMGSPYYDTEEGNRGMRWDSINRDGMARLPIAGTRIQEQLDTSPQGTFELVLQVEDVQMGTSRFLNIGTDNESDFAIGSSDLGELQIRWDGGGRIRFAHTFTGDREVLHVVVDTEQPRPNDRIVAYIDGSVLQPVEDPPSDFPEQAEGFPFLGSSVFVLGNRDNGSRSFEGALRYAALYTTAFGSDDVAANTALLLESDDE